MKKISKETSRHILMIGEYFKNSAPGGMAAVLASYDENIENMQFVPSWKNGGLGTKLWYAIYSYAVFVCYMLFDKGIRIVHIQGAAFASFERNTFFVRVGKAFGKKVILHMHCADFETYFRPSNHKNRILNTINSCDKFIVLSEEWKDYFSSIGVSKEIIVVLNNTISLPIVQNMSYTEEEKAKLKLLYLGIIGQRKGIYDLLNVIVSDVNLYRGRLSLHIGGNCEEEKIKKIIADNGIDDIVIFEGFVKGDNKIRDLNWADVFILPSYNEGLPIAILEAMSYGMPIISTKVGGIPSIVKNDINGKLIEAGNLKQIKDSLDYYLNHRDMVKTHGTQSLNMVKPFLPEGVFCSLTGIYNELLIC